MERVPQLPPDQKDVDVLFYGELLDRRRTVLEALGARCHVKFLWNVYAAERDAWIARSKIVLNMHLHDGHIFEQARVSYLLNNRAFVVSESAADNPYGDDSLLSAAYEDLVEVCLDYVQRTDDRKRIADRGYEQIRSQPMAENLRKALST